ncbi:MAG: acetyl-CoA carboxylase biotin carboxylase subunit [Nitrospirota bacterium]|nr:acetyl-CoA carboxylase biotin carboxylase subunit [Nitrospirota bacterium]
MFEKILIANRGEIAIRVIRACKELGIKTVAVCSEIDQDALHVLFADERVCIGPADNSLSYRNIPNIVSAASVTGAQAIHPGYGFLAENPRFAEIVESCGIKFIGPDAHTIAEMGHKARAKELMIEAGVPVVPGSEGLLPDDDDEIVRIGERVGYPLMVKASAGGGGRGMRVVTDPDSLIDSVHAARSEAEGAFGDGSVYMERFFPLSRHVEIQILADHYGNVVHLGERDCSVQRRNQKLIEESPSPIVTPEMRQKMGDAALKAARGVNYKNAGTVEFLVDPEGNFYFIEMNTRIQVEHPVTEMVTGIDLIKEQIRVAYGEHLSFTQEDITYNGHAIECRINAEDPKTFMPSPGIIAWYHPPGGPGVRVDSAAYTNYAVPPQYDSMVAKVIVHGNTRAEAVAKMHRALEEMVLDGIRTTIPLFLDVLKDDVFKSGDYTTRYLEEFFARRREKEMHAMESDIAGKGTPSKARKKGPDSRKKAAAS